MLPITAAVRTSCGTDGEIRDALEQPSVSARSLAGPTSLLGAPESRFPNHVSGIFASSAPLLNLNQLFMKRRFIISAFPFTPSGGGVVGLWGWGGVGGGCMDVFQESLALWALLADALTRRDWNTSLQMRAQPPPPEPEPPQRPGAAGPPFLNLKQGNEMQSSAGSRVQSEGRFAGQRSGREGRGAESLGRSAGLFNSPGSEIRLLGDGAVQEVLALQLSSFPLRSALVPSSSCLAAG